MEKFLTTITAIKKTHGSSSFHGVEEPCERFAQKFDIYHGRAFTDTRWPVSGPGAVSIPLYLFLYHEYQLGYAGWIDRGFSPSRNIKYGLGRAYIFGMLPGIRSNGKTKLRDPISEELLMLKSYIKLIKYIPQYALYGKMIGEAYIGNSLPFKHSTTRRKPVPIHWSSVQGIIWQAPQDNNKAILLANMSNYQQSVIVNVNELKSNKLEIIGSNKGRNIKKCTIEKIGTLFQ